MKKHLSQAPTGAVALAVLLLLSSLSHAQSLGPDAYGIPSQFGMQNPTTTRQLAMGGLLCSVLDEQNANPAFAARQTKPHAGVRMVTTDLDRGPTLTSWLAEAYEPLHPNQDGLQFVAISLGSSGGDPTILPGTGPARADLSEDAFLVDYGRSFGNQFSAGLSVLGYQRSKFTMAMAGAPQLLNLTADADMGFRLGAAHEWRPGDFIGLIGSWAQNSISASGLMLGGASQVVFHSTELSLGASYHVTPELLTAVEFRHSQTTAGPLGGTSSEWHLGAEYKATPQWAVRAGLSDSSPTFGLGYVSGGWHFDYAFIRDWNKDAVSQLFGGSDTQSLQATFSW